MTYATNNAFNANGHFDPGSPEALEALARRRAGAKMGWYIHVMVYVAVNLGLAALATMSSKNWAVYPALGWGLGLLIHGLVVTLRLSGGGLYSRLLSRERARLKAERW